MANGEAYPCFTLSYNELVRFAEDLAGGRVSRGSKAGISGTDKTGNVTQKKTTGKGTVKAPEQLNRIAKSKRAAASTSTITPKAHTEALTNNRPANIDRSKGADTAVLPAHHGQRGRGHAAQAKKGKMGMRADHSDADNTSDSDSHEGPIEIDSSIYYTTSLHDRERRRTNRKLTSLTNTQHTENDLYHPQDSSRRKRQAHDDSQSMEKSQVRHVQETTDTHMHTTIENVNNTYKPFLALEKSVPNATKLLSRTRRGASTRGRRGTAPRDDRKQHQHVFPTTQTSIPTHMRAAYEGGRRHSKDERADDGRHFSSSRDRRKSQHTIVSGIKDINESDGGSENTSHSESDGGSENTSHSELSEPELDSSSSHNSLSFPRRRAQRTQRNEHKHRDGSGSAEESEAGSNTSCSSSYSESEDMSGSEESGDESDLESFLHATAARDAHPRVLSSTGPMTLPMKNLRGDSGDRVTSLSRVHGAPGLSGKQLFDPNSNKFVEIVPTAVGGALPAPPVMGIVQNALSSHAPTKSSTRDAPQRSSRLGSRKHSNTNSHKQTQISTNDKIEKPKSRVHRTPREKAVSLCKHANRKAQALREAMKTTHSRESKKRLKIARMSGEIGQYYLDAFLTDIKYAHSCDADKKLWREAFYPVVEMYRRFVRQINEVITNRQTTSFYDDDFEAFQNAAQAMVEEVSNELAVFITTSLAFYQGLVDKLQERYHFRLELAEGTDYTFAGYGEPLWLKVCANSDMYEHEHEHEDDDLSGAEKEDISQLGLPARPRAGLSKGAKFAQLTCHHSFVALGDLGRYYQQLHYNEDPDYTECIKHYACARSLCPRNSRPYNQLGVIATYQESLFKATYYFIRSLAVKVPFMTARDTLLNVFEKLRVMVLENAPVVLADKSTDTRQVDKRGKAMSSRSQASASASSEVWMLSTGLVWSEGFGKLCFQPYTGKETTLLEDDNDDNSAIANLDSSLIPNNISAGEQKKLDQDIWALGGVETVCWRFVHHSLYVHATLFTRVGLNTTQHFSTETLKELNILLKTHVMQPWLAPGCLVELMSVLLKHQDDDPVAKSDVLHAIAVNFAAELYIHLSDALARALNDDFLSSLPTVNVSSKAQTHGTNDVPNNDHTHTHSGQAHWRTQVHVNAKPCAHHTISDLPLTEAQYNIIRLVLPALKVFTDWMSSSPELWVSVLGSARALATRPDVVRRFWANVARLGNIASVILEWSSPRNHEQAICEGNVSEDSSANLVASMGMMDLKTKGTSTHGRTPVNRPIQTQAEARIPTHVHMHTQTRALWEDRLLAGLAYLSSVHSRLPFYTDPDCDIQVDENISGIGTVGGDDAECYGVSDGGDDSVNSIDIELRDDLERWHCLARFTKSLALATTACTLTPTQVPEHTHAHIHPPTSTSAVGTCTPILVATATETDTAQDGIFHNLNPYILGDVMSGLLYYDTVTNKYTSDPSPLVLNSKPKRKSVLTHEHIEDNPASLEGDMQKDMPGITNEPDRRIATDSDGLADLLKRKEYLTSILASRARSAEAVRVGLSESAQHSTIRMCVTPEYICFDTNLYIDHLKTVSDMVAGQTFVVLCPLVVVNELRGLAKGEKVKEQATKAITYLEKEFNDRNPWLKAVTAHGTFVNSIRFSNEDNPDGHSNDDLILGACLHVSDEKRRKNGEATRASAVDRLNRHVVLVTDDVNVRVKAKAKMIPTRSFSSFVRLLSMASLAAPPLRH
eukprot:CFRG6785T1